MVRSPLHFHGRIPVPEVAPLTYRDGVTHLELVYELSQYLKNILHPSLQSTVDKVVADAEQLLSDATAQYVDGVQEFQRIHDAFMSDVNAHLVALNDGAVTDLVEDETSKLGSTLRDIFAKHSDLQDFQESTNTRITEFEESTDTRLTEFEESTHEAVESVAHRLDDRRYTVSHEAYNIVSGDVSSLENALSVVPSNVILTLPVDMEFNLSNTLNIDRPVHIRGGVFRGGGNMIHVSSSGVVLEDMRIVGAGVEELQRLSAAIRFAGTPGHLIDATLRNVTVEYVGFTGIHVEWCENFLVEQCSVEHFKYAGIGVNSGFHGVIRDNDIRYAYSTARDKHNSYGIYVTNRVEYGVQSRSEDVEVYGNRIHSVPNWEGIDTHNGVNIHIHDNVITACRRGIALVSSMSEPNSGVDDNRVIGNYVDCEGFSTEHFSTSTGVTLQSGSTGLGVNAIIIGNTLRNSDTPVTFSQNLPGRYIYDKCVVHSNVGDPGQRVNGTVYDTGWVNPNDFVILAGGVTLHPQDSFRMRVVGDITGRTVYGRGRVSRGSGDLVLRVLGPQNHLIPSGAVFAGAQNKHVIGRAIRVSNGATASLYLHDDRRVRMSDEAHDFGSGTVQLDFMWRIGNDGS